MHGTCLRCGRPLSNKTSIKRGYGNTCYKKVEKAKTKGKLENEIVELNFVDELKEREDNKNV